MYLYFLKASFGYNGSERFAKKNRMGFFPSVGGAWIVSKENFMRRVANWMPFCKVRASYGKVGNDGIIETPRFVYMPQVEPTDIGAYHPEPGKDYLVIKYRIMVIPI